MQVGTVYAALTFDTSGLKQGIAEAKTAYSGLQQAGQTAFQSVAEYAASAAGQTTAALGSIGSAEEQAANKALALAQAEARLLQTQGDLAGAVARLSEGLEVGGASSARYAQAQNQLEQTQQRVSTQALQQAQAEARLAVEQGNAAAGAARLAGAIESERGALSATTQGTIALTNAERQLEQVQKQAQSGSQGFDQSLGGIKNTLGGLGIVLGVQQIAQYGVEAGKAALELTQTETQLRQVAGSQQTYDTILAAARQQQILYGGSLNDNLQQLSSFAVVSRTTGASLEDLIRTSQRLALLNSEQGIAGAKIGLAEALAGQTRSLQTRFNIPSQELAKLRDVSTSAAEKLQILNQYLDKAGISANGAADSVSKEAKSFNALAAAADNAKVKFGAFLTTVATAPTYNGKGAVDNLTNALNAPDNLQKGRTDALANAKSYDAYTAAVKRLNTELGISTNARAALAAQQGQLTAREFAFAQGLIKTGTAADVANGQALALRTTFAQFDQLQTKLNANFDNAQGFGKLSEQLARVAAVSPAAASSVNGLIGAYIAGKITADQLNVALAGLEKSYYANTQATQASAQATAAKAALDQSTYGQLQANIAATQQAAQAEQEHAQSLTDDAAKALTNQAATEELSLKKQQLAQQAQIAAQALFAAGNAGAAAAAQLANSSSSVDVLTAAYYRLAAAQAAANQAKTNAGALSDQRAGERDGGSARTANQIDVANGNARARAAVQRTEAEAQYKADLAIARAKKDTGTEIELLRQKQQGLNKDSAAYKEIEAQIIGVEESADKQGKKRGAGKLSDQQQLNNKLAAGQDKLNDTLDNNQIKADQQAEDAEKKHGEALLKIEHDYEQKSLEQQKKNETDKRRSRFDFYKSLLGASKDLAPATTARISAEYEQDFAKSQELAKQGKRKEAQEYLALKKQQRQDEIAYEQELAGAQKAAKEAKTKEERKAAQTEVAQLQNLRKLQLDAQNEEEKQLLKGGDALQNDKQQQLDQEASSYDKSRDKIATSAERNDERAARSSEQSADRQVASAERAGKKIDANTAKIERQAGAYDKVAAPSTRDRVQAAQASTPDTPDAPDKAAGSAGPLPVSLDIDLNGLIGDLKEALTTKLADLITAAKDEITATKEVSSGLRGLSGKFAG